MKKKLSKLLCCMLLITCFCNMIVCAASDYHCMDFVSLLSAQEKATLEEKIQRISTEQGYSVGAVLYETRAEYETWIEAAGNDYIVMAVDLLNRDMHLNVNGSAYYVLNDSEKARISDEVAPYFTAGNYAQGLEIFLNMTESIATGEQLPMGTAELEQKRSLILGSFLCSLLMAACITYSFVRGMNNVQEQQNASNYEEAGGFHLTKDKAIYLYRTTVATPKPRNDTNGGSRGGGSSFSGGHSRKF